jgi:hypothetical protein
MAKANTLKLTFKQERDTKNTIRFTEVVEDELDAQKIGSIYLSKPALKELGWTRGASLELTVSVK